MWTYLIYMIFNKYYQVYIVFDGKNSYVTQGDNNS